MPEWQNEPIFSVQSKDMNTVTVKISVINQLTGATWNNNPGVEISNYSFDTMEANANAFADLMPDCQVSMQASIGDLICIPSRNMMKDEKEMPFGEFMAKWYNAKKSFEEEEIQWEFMNGDFGGYDD